MYLGVRGMPALAPTLSPCTRPGADKSLLRDIQSLLCHLAAGTPTRASTTWRRSLAPVCTAGLFRGVSEYVSVAITHKEAHKLVLAGANSQRSSWGGWPAGRTKPAPRAAAGRPVTLAATLCWRAPPALCRPLPLPGSRVGPARAGGPRRTSADLSNTVRPYGTPCEG